MRMHYTWIAGDINFLAWTCSGPWRAAWWVSVCEDREGVVVSMDEVGSRAERTNEGKRGWIVRVAGERTDERTNERVAKGGEGEWGECMEERWRVANPACFLLTRPTTCQLSVLSTYFLQSRWFWRVVGEVDDEKKWLNFLLSREKTKKMR